MEIYNKVISDDKLELIVSVVRSKKELAAFSEFSILNYAEFIFKRDKKVLELFVDNDVDKISSSKLFKQLVKDIRAIARRIYGVYITKNYSKRQDLLDKYDFSSEGVNDLLELHMSTKERIGFYEEVYGKIVDLTGSPNSVLDLACGFNPLASIFLDEGIEYYASDISEVDVEFLNEFMERSVAKGKLGGKSSAFRLDLTKEENFEALNSYDCDWCLLFKALDPIEEISENITYDLLDYIKTKWIVVSFPTVSVSRKPMKNPRRNWFEKVLDRKELNFNIFEIENEIFYVIENEEK